MNKEQKYEAMKELRDNLLNDKTLPLYTYRTENKFFPVLGEGSHVSNIVFVGEAPGRNEAKTGKPFCGAAGKILDELLESVGINRNEIYITNIVNDRPPENRDPLPEEIKAYAPTLDRVLEIIEPKVIATLGRFSMDYIMRKFDLGFDIEPISHAHGKSFTAKAKWGKLEIIPLYHPAAAIYNQSLKETLKLDFQILKKYTNLTK